MVQWSFNICIDIYKYLYDSYLLYIYILYLMYMYMWYVYFCIRSSLASGSLWNARICTGKSSSSTRQAANYTDMCCSPETKYWFQHWIFFINIYCIHFKVCIEFISQSLHTYVWFVCRCEGTSTINEDAFAPFYPIPALPGHNLQAVDNEAEQAGDDLATELMAEYLGGDTWTQLMIWVAHEWFTRKK